LNTTCAGKSVDGAADEGSDRAHDLAHVFCATLSLNLSNSNTHLAQLRAWGAEGRTPQHRAILQHQPAILLLPWGGRRSCSLRGKTVEPGGALSTLLSGTGQESRCQWRGAACCSRWHHAAGAAACSPGRRESRCCKQTAFRRSGREQTATAEGLHVYHVYCNVRISQPFRSLPRNKGFLDISLIERFWLSWRETKLKNSIA